MIKLLNISSAYAILSRVISLTSFFLLFVFYLNGQQGFRLTFVLKTTSLPDSSSVFLTGSLPQLGNWNPTFLKMSYAGNQTWQSSINLSAPASIEYKYTLGSWERENATGEGNPLPNFSIRIHGDTTINDVVLNWTRGTKRIIKGQVTGQVKYHKQMSGDSILPRDIVVWLPPGYNQRQRYPVLYMHDGQNIFDPATSAFGVDWQIDETCDSLIRLKLIKPLIVVGIYNTRDRMQEYVPGRKGTLYMRFITDKLKPFIDSAYRTKRSAEHTLTGGSSAGGTVAFMLSWEHPKIFSKAICMSPALKISHIDYVNVVRNSARKNNLFIYLDNGGIGLEEQLQPGIDAMINILEQKGLKKGKHYIFVSDKNATHNEAAWARRFPPALLSCF